MKLVWSPIKIKGLNESFVVSNENIEVSDEMAAGECSGIWESPMRLSPGSPTLIHVIFVRYVDLYFTYMPMPRNSTLGFCLSVFVNEEHLKLEKTT